MTLKKTSIIISSFILLGMFSCNSTDSNSETTAVESAATTTETSNVVVPPPVSTPVLNDQPSELMIKPPTQSGQFSGASTVAAGINPAHGMPGHDCAIAVGAPLKRSTSVPTASPVTTNAPVNQTIVPTETKSITTSAPNVKVNPAHGQPGHDCAIAVGAPLPIK